MRTSAIGQMAAGITHEINTPLTYVKGNFEMLVEDIMAVLPDSPRKTWCWKIRALSRWHWAHWKYYSDDAWSVTKKPWAKRSMSTFMRLLLSSLALSYNRSKQIVTITINDKPFDLNLPKQEYSFMGCVQKQRIEQVWVIILNNALLK